MSGMREMEWMMNEDGCCDDSLLVQLNVCLYGCSPCVLHSHSRRITSTSTSNLSSREYEVEYVREGKGGREACPIVSSLCSTLSLSLLSSLLSPSFLLSTFCLNKRRPKVYFTRAHSLFWHPPRAGRENRRAEQGVRAERAERAECRWREHYALTRDSSRERDKGTARDSR